ncbi:MAG: ABC transporter permease [Pseudobdellovibrionaceae bacterium]
MAMKNVLKKYQFLLLYFFILFICILYAFLKIDPDFINADRVLARPSLDHFFGTDFLGRDYFYQVIMGSLISQLVGFLGSLGLLFVALFFVIVLKSTHFVWFKNFAMMFLDVFQSLPNFIINAVFALLFAQFFSSTSLLSQSLISIVLSISLTYWMNPARLLSAQLEKVLKEPFIEGAQAIGAKKRWIYMRHILPHMKDTLFLLFFLYFPQSILQETILSFIGLGIQSPYSSWGSLMQQGFGSLQTHPHLMLFPSAMVFITMMVFQITFKKQA